VTGQRSHVQAAHVQAPEAALRSQNEGKSGPREGCALSTLCRGRRKLEPPPSACSHAPYGTEGML